tara:strand:+ start:21 stop:722 length:702 start_codon:yes stop_codon:yes gene_type:complete
MSVRLFFLFFICFKGLSQTTLPSFHGVYNPNKIPTNGQVSYFNFSSGESGYTFSGVAATSDKNGNVNSAVELDDASDKITGQFSELLNNDFTVSIWAKLNTSQPTRKMWLISFGAAITNKAFHLGTRYDNSLNGNYRVGSWNANHATDDYLGNDYTWKHYVVTYDKSEQEYKFYINNSLEYTQSNHSLTIDATDFVIGSQLGYSESWYGKIDEFGAWSRVLSSQEITDLYNNY